MNVVEIKNLSYSYGTNQIFDKLNLTVKKGASLTVLGPVGSGKTTLVNLINHGHKKITINGSLITILSNPNSQIIGKTVLEQLHAHMELNHYTTRKINSRTKKIISYFELEDMLSKDPFNISMGQRQLIVILSYLLLDSDIIIFDNAFSLLDFFSKKKLFDYIRNIKKTTIINFTSNSEDALLGKEVAILNKKILLQESLTKAYTNDRIFLNNGLNLPFVADLSLKLRYYNMIDKILLDMDDLVDEVWK